MHKSLIFLFLIFSMGVAIASHHYGAKQTVVQNDLPFEVELSVEQQDKEHYDLVATLDLDHGSYAISPHSKDNVYMHFNVLVEDSDHLKVDKSLLEAPSSYEEFDQILEEVVRFIRTKTTYRKGIRILTEQNFDVSGHVEFLVEPQCIPYQVDFVISRRDGRLHLVTSDPKFHFSYKG